jgi:hypothetical protein
VFGSDSLALAQAVAMYVGIAVSCLGWGELCRALLGLRSSPARALTLSIWLGWATTLFIWQVLHLFVPLNAVTVTPALAIGVILALGRIPNYIRTVKNRLRGRAHVWTAVAVASIVVLWVASRSMLSPTHYDSGLYHLSAIRWINTYAIVPGLGNLHFRLAFNQSFFCYAAALNLFPLFDHGYAIANSFLFLLSGVTAVELATLRRARARCSGTLRPTEGWAELLILPFLVFAVLSSPNLASPAPDLAVALLQLVMLLFLAEYLLEPDRANDLERTGHGVLLIVLAAATVTVKLSSLAYCVTVAAIVLVCELRTSKWRLRATVPWLRASALALLLLMAWSARGFVLSGTPLYPSTLGYGIASVDWRIPESNVIRVERGTRSWARQPHAPINETLRGWSWLRPWAKRIVHRRHLVFAALLSLAFIAASSWLRWTRGRRVDRSRLSWWLLAPAGVGLVYWFVMAPSPRFASAQIWCLAYGSGIVFLQSIGPGFSFRRLLRAVGLVLLVSSLWLIRSRPGDLRRFTRISISGWQPIRRVDTIEETSLHGVVVRVPKQGDQCWDAPLPCTPHLDPGLALRVPGDLAAGFRLRQRPLEEMK